MRSTQVFPNDSATSEDYNLLLADAKAAAMLLPHQQLGYIQLPTNPTNGQTLTITVNGTAIVITFVNSIGVTPGNVLIAGTAALTAVNLLALLNHPTLTTAQYVALSASNAGIIIYAQYALNVGGTTITPCSVNLNGYTPLTTFHSFHYRHRRKLDGADNGKFMWSQASASLVAQK